MKIPILSRLFNPRAGPKNSLWQNAYAFFFGPTPSGKTVNERTAMAAESPCDTWECCFWLFGKVIFLCYNLKNKNNGDGKDDRRIKP
ncbi:MAG: hypothetical protein ACOX7L_00410 [Dethiobacteria bacterium]|jgi:hypothetical protein